jgi:hydrogenase maturation protein HypF
MESKKIVIKGLVQGVGFRPAVYRIAHKYGIYGTVENTNSGVIVLAESDGKQMVEFITALPNEIPLAASISSIQIETIERRNYKDFTITKSSTTSDEVTEVSPDIAVCSECLEDLKYQQHRKNFPLINCTNCGPRFTIIKALPYDRPLTTMAPFTMCNTCRSEYTNVLDRRFHAQPVACNACGPTYSLHTNTGVITDITSILDTAAKLIEEGNVLAIKGMGGFHLSCDAFNPTALKKLRAFKLRDGKPFALMARDLKHVKRIALLNEAEEKLLESWRRPIVLVKNQNPLSEGVAVGLNTVGIMLPYMPFHYLLFKELKTNFIVLTSGNISDEPIIIDNQVSIDSFRDKANAILTYNREIYNRTDDSVTFVINNKPRLIRRSRGYAPSPIQTELDTEGIFAAGAELVNCFAIGKGNQAILSQHIGDLKNMETLDFYKESISRYSELFRFKPTLAVADLHPDYLSTKYVNGLNIPTTYVQHHHAHMASCMVEHNLTDKAIGICFDGTGLGTDGHIWGGEFLHGDLIDFERFAHLEYIPQPGGDAVSKHPWRMMVAYLNHFFSGDFNQIDPSVFNGINPEELNIIKTMLKNKINSPLTSSVGRLFDAVSALLGICLNSTYHAEAPMQLEAIADASIIEKYTWSGEYEICFKPAFMEILIDLAKKTPLAIIAGKFHNTLVDVVVSTSKIMRKQLSINTVVLSGGSFQNRILLQKTENQLKECNFAVYSQESVPSNDGGIALGQLAIAAQRRKHNQL